MATAPAADQRRLLDVQALDTRAQQLAHRRRTLPEAARVAELDGQLADLHASLVASRTALADLRRELTRAEDDVEQVRVRTERDQQQLDSGQVDARTAQALMGELESLARRRDKLEEIQLDVMERVESHETTLASVEKAHADLVAARDAAVAERDARLAEIDVEAAGLAAEREDAVAGIDSALVALYERVRAQNGGQAVVALRGQMFDGLSVTPPRAEMAQIVAAAPDQVVRLEDTGHIVVRLDA